MKTLICLLCSILFLTVNCSSQNTDTATYVVNINALPPEGVVLDKGWKFTVGDASAYARADYDDSKWQGIDPTKDIHDISALWNNKIVWFRIHLAVDSALVGKLAMIIQQSGASEMYLDGKLFQKFGVVSANGNEVIAYSPKKKPFAFPIKNTSEQVLAIRYVLQPHIYYGTHYGTANLGIRMFINTVGSAVDNYEGSIISDKQQNAFRAGVFLMLGILHLAFYLFYKTQKANLYFSVYSICFSVNWYISQISFYKVKLWFWVNNSLLIMMVIGLLFLLTAIYTLFDEKRSWLYYALFALGIISIPAAAFIYGWGWFIFAFLFNNIIPVAITFIAYKALRNKKEGAWIIIIGGAAYVVLWIIFCLQWTGVLGGSAIDMFTLTFLCIPISVSIYLGYDFALTHHTLQRKFTEVETLSIEKQQILAAQNEVLEQQVTQRTAELKQSLEELKATQAQLIQSEKLASLGELTAGIAHEIKNPLNFVNNFSDVNQELLQELKEEADEGNIEEVKAIANDVIANEEKINYHGKCADAIVKGMLQHSRQSSGQKEPTDINKLADEYLRLSYHGLRAKDKNFNATIETHFDQSIGKINILPQDIGRVLLNLFNNAFYAVNEQKSKNHISYEPTVSVSTKKIDNKVEIKVKDNGNGIPQNIIDKIFQPFFTTKPTGQGTGLGLSLSYDIIKAHGGEIKVESKEGEGTVFIIQLPV